MRDYIREGLANYDAPPRIYDKICKALENPALTENERKELLEQKEKAEKMAMKTSILFPFGRTIGRKWSIVQQIQGADGTNKESFILYVDFALQQ